MGNITDVFVSYGHADADWVRTLAENLHHSGLEVWFDEWTIAPGDVLVHRLDAGILNAKNGILVVSPTALERPWVQEEYAAMMTRAVAGQQWLIPVSLKDAEMPPLLASRVWVDFRSADGPVYETQVKELVRALKSERPSPPPCTGDLKPPPGTGYRLSGGRGHPPPAGDHTRGRRSALGDLAASLRWADARLASARSSLPPSCLAQPRARDQRSRPVAHPGCEQTVRAAGFVRS